jgi:hypothetical protein
MSPPLPPWCGGVGPWSSAWAGAYGKTLASGERGEGTVVSLWDVATGKELPPLLEQPREAWGLSFSFDGKKLAGACGRDNPALRLWDVEKRKQLRQMETAGQQTATVAFSANGKLLASGRLNGQVCLWEVLTGKEIAQVAAHRSVSYGTYSVSFSADSKTLVSGGEDRFVRLWQVRGLGEGPRTWKAELAGGDLEAFGNDLAATDASQAYEAIWALAAAPRQALPLCREHLLPSPPAKDPQLPQRLARLIADLDANEFEVREKATLDLGKLGTAAEAAVRQALENPASLEARRRLERVLAPLEEQPAANVRRGLRSVEVLEQIGTPEARDLLKKVAKEASEAWLRQEAEAALDRLQRLLARP